ncbi:MAG: AAA-like domain-containing protein [Rivularia sp. (in: Bacteria)]|nr:AAA-like domain-containing protein [Rivularia sp. MS3]
MSKLPSNYEYQIGGSLSAQASSYVTRKADLEFYQALKAGEFCYVLNSRQMGKSSLRVQTMQKLQASGIVCAFIDLTGIGKEDVTAEKWYAGIVQSLISSTQLSKKINWRKWWKERRDLLSPVQRLNLFIDEILLVEIQQRIVIFVDEIDRVLSQSFSLDDFFGLIRFFYNKRVDNPEYKRLTFALLGVATPSDLIADKTQTPFNIGKAIELQGFKVDEVEPLAKGLTGVDNPQAVIEEILNWTGGQPFLTQKLCQIVSNYARRYNLVNSKLIPEIVENNIIYNWESKDEPEHLKTIRDRILRNENKAGILLGIYQEILDKNVLADGSLEQTDLRLSGLVIQNQGKLKVYNSIYKSIFNQNWVEKQLESLRPYYQSFNTWVASNYQDESRLLQGQALKDALSWANNQQLSPLDYRFLSASQELEQRQIKLHLTVKEEESQILAQANDTLTYAQKKAKKIIIFGSIFFAISLISALFTGLELIRARRERVEANLSFQSAAIENTLYEQPFDGLIEALKVAKQIQVLATPISVDKKTRKQIKKTLNQAISLVREQNRVEVNNSQLTDVSVSPDGQFIATGASDSKVKVWDIKGNFIKTFMGHSGEIWNVRFSPDGNTLASSSRDGTIRLWNVKTGKLKKTILAHNNTWVRSISFSPDGKLLVSSGSKGWVKLWNVADGKLIQEIPAHRNPVRWVTYVKFSPDGKTIASTSTDRTIKLWQLEDGKLLTIPKIFRGHKTSVRTVDFSPDGKTIASTGADSTVRLWNIDNGKQIQNFLGHRGEVWGVNFSSDGRQLVSSGTDGTLKLWNLNTPDTQPQTLKGHLGVIRGVTFSPDGKKLFSVANSTLRIWSLKDIEPQTLLANDGGVLAVSFSPVDNIIASAGIDKNIKLWNVKDRKLQATFKGHTKDILDISFSPDGKLLASASSDKTIKLWNLENGTEIYSRKGHTGKVYSVSFSPDGTKFASASNDRMVKIWSVADGDLLQTLKGHVHTVKAVSFSPDGTKFASASSDGRVIFWNVNNGRMSQVFDTGMGYLHALAFSPDNKLIATGGNQGIIKTWDIENEKELQPFKAHREWIRSIRFSPDGKILASGSFDDTIKLWNVKDAQLLKTMSGHLNKVDQISFSPDGKTIASASRDGTVKLWKLDLDLDDLTKLGCAWLQDYLAIHPKEKELKEICNQQS